MSSLLDGFLAHSSSDSRSSNKLLDSYTTPIVAPSFFFPFCFFATGARRQLIPKSQEPLLTLFDVQRLREVLEDALVGRTLDHLQRRVEVLGDRVRRVGEGPVGTVYSVE